VVAGGTAQGKASNRADSGGGRGSSGDRGPKKFQSTAAKESDSKAKVERVEAFLRSVAGSRGVQEKALRKAIPGLSHGFLEANFDVKGGVVRSYEAMARQTLNVANFLRARGGSADLTSVLRTFPVAMSWLRRSEAFEVRGARLHLAAATSPMSTSSPPATASSSLGRSAQRAAEGEEDVWALSPSELLDDGREPDQAAALAIQRLSRWLRQDAMLPAERVRSLRRLLAMWHPDLASPGPLRQAVAEVFCFLNHARGAELTRML